jgi:hypothetical protein
MGNRPEQLGKMLRPSFFYVFGHFGGLGPRRQAPPEIERLGLIEKKSSPCGLQAKKNRQWQALAFSAALSKGYLRQAPALPPIEELLTKWAVQNRILCPCRQ